MPLSPINPSKPPATTPDARNADRLAAIERRLRTIESYLSGGSTQQLPVVAIASFPPGRLGRVVVDSSSLKVYRDNGSSWVAVG